LDQDVRFGVLGTVTAWRGAHQVRFGAGKHRLLLAALLPHNDSVDREEIIEFLWPAAAPASAVNLVQKYVGDLRRALRPAEQILVSAGGSPMWSSMPRPTGPPAGSTSPTNS
jgi:DNA-binding SARP family transcriptional activator